MDNNYEKGFVEGFGGDGIKVLQDATKQNKKLHKRIDQYVKDLAEDNPDMDQSEYYERLGEMQGRMLRNQVQIDKGHVKYSRLARKWLLDDQSEIEDEHENLQDIEKLSDEKQLKSHDAYHEVHESKTKLKQNSFDEPEL